jgi:hypothetical protein
MCSKACGPRSVRAAGPTLQPQPPAYATPGWSMLPGSFLLPGFHQLDKLGDSLRAHLGTALGRVNPS